MRERNPNVVDVRVLNSENISYHCFTVREDRLRDFYQSILKDRRVQPDPWMPGLSYAATFGVKAIFCRVPEKFPALDILVWLRANQKQYLGEYPNPTIALPELEIALERFATLAPQLYQDGSGDEIRTEPNE